MLNAARKKVNVFFFLWCGHTTHWQGARRRRKKGWHIFHSFAFFCADCFSNAKWILKAFKNWFSIRLGAMSMSTLAVLLFIAIIELYLNSVWDFVACVASHICIQWVHLIEKLGPGSVLDSRTAFFPFVEIHDEKFHVLGIYFLYWIFPYPVYVAWHIRHHQTHCTVHSAHTSLSPYPIEGVRCSFNYVCVSVRLCEQ